MITSIIPITNVDAHRAIVIASRTKNSFVTGMLVSSIHTLKAELAKRIVKVTFMKKDGTITTRFATTLPEMTSRYVNGRGLDADSRNVVCFWDCTAPGENKWRSFRYERLISFE